jgi:hypothetical protein
LNRPMACASAQREREANKEWADEQRLGLNPIHTTPTQTREETDVSNGWG